MERAHLKVYQTLKPGDTELQIARRVHAQNLLEGADFTNHVTVNAGKNTTIGLRYIPDETPIQPGDVVTIDTGCKFAGYTTDLSRPVVVGKPSEHQRSMWHKLWEANRTAIEATRPGVKASEMYAHLRSDPEYSNVWFYAHGLGLFVHEPPLCEPYQEHGMQTSSTFSANWEIQPNMMLMVENSLRDPEHGQNYHFEDLVLVTEGGARLLSNLMDTREMFVVE
jgi:Xaa-Pro aminopeptidase